MLAILVAGERQDPLGHAESTPHYLLRLGDRPFLQYIVESLVLQGVKRFEFVFADSAAPSEAYFGDGSRWGCSFNFHLLSRAGLKPLLRSLAAQAKTQIVLGRTDRLPAFGSQPLQPWRELASTVFFTSQKEGAQPGVWTGWAVFPNRLAFSDHLDANIDSVLRVDPQNALLRTNSERIPIGHEFSVGSGVAILRAQEDLFSGQFPDLAIGGRQIKPGVWTGRNVSLHPSAKVIAPVYIGANTRICAHAQVGPCSVIAEDCIVGADSIVCRSLINVGSYVGESLEIHQSIVDHEQITDVKAGTSYRMSDQFLVGSLLETKTERFFRGLCDRFLAAILLVFFSPVLALLFLLKSRSAGLLLCEQAVRIPHEPQQYRWRSFSIYRLNIEPGAPGLEDHFQSVFLPGLLSVVKGSLSLVGVKPRCAREVEDMPEDWQALYLKTKAGLVTDAIVNFDPHLTEDELRASECYYSATESFSQDLRLLGLYLLKLTKAMPDKQPELQ